MKNRKNNGIPAIKAFIVILVGILIAVSATSIIYSFYNVLDYREFEMRLQAVEGKRIGFNLDPGVFNFGKVPLGASAKRNATVSNSYPNEIIVRIEVAGSIRKMVAVEENYFFLPANTTKEIEIIASVPEDQKLGNYSGKLKVYFERP